MPGEECSRGRNSKGRCPEAEGGWHVEEQQGEASVARALGEEW